MSDLENTNELNEENNANESAATDETPSVILEYFEEDAKENKPKVTEKLMTFYKLSKIDKELFEIEEVKGDLPDVIADLREKVTELASQLGTQIECL